MRDAPGLTAVVRRELRRLRTQRVYPLLLAMPLAGWGLLLGVFGRHVARDLPVAVVDLDGSALSRRLVRAIDATPAARVVAGRGDAPDAEGFPRRGEAYAVVVLPAGLERDVERGAAPRVQALTNGVWLLPTTLVGRDVRAAVATVSAELEVHARVARGEPRRGRRSPPSRCGPSCARCSTLRSTTRASSSSPSCQRCCT